MFPLVKSMNGWLQYTLNRQEMDFVKNLGEARQLLADLQEDLSAVCSSDKASDKASLVQERYWHQEAMKKLKESHEDQKKTRDAEVTDLETSAWAAHFA